MAGSNDKQVFNKISEEIVCKTAVKAVLDVPGVAKAERQLHGQPQQDAL